MSDNQYRWLYIDFNSYFASVEQQNNPSLRGKPVAVVPVMTDYTCAIAASYEAKAFGIKTGTPIHEARRKCPGLICILGNHETYVDFHQRAIIEVEKHVPVTKVASIDEMACRLMSNECSFEAAYSLASRIKSGLASALGEHVRCSIGLAPNWYLAKVATDMQKPDGLVFISKSELPGCLLDLSPRDLPGVGANMERRLAAAGVRSMTQLWGLSPKQMRKIWGSVTGERLWMLLRGHELPDEPTSRSTVGHSQVLPPELRPPEMARLAIRRLTLKAASRLRRLSLRCSGLALSIRTEYGARYAVDCTLPQVQDNLALTKKMEELWTALAPQIGSSRIKKVSVLLHKLTEEKKVQPDFFSAENEMEKMRKKAEELSRVADRLNARYGRDTVSLGILPKRGKNMAGTKIAFTRIPDMDEFNE